MKKRAALFLSILLVFSLLCGCNQAPASPGTAEAANAPAISLSEIKIGFILDNTATDGGWNEQMVESMDRTIEKLRLKPEQVITIESIASGTPELDSSVPSK